jgi:hypothetical protein
MQHKTNRASQRELWQANVWSPIKVKHKWNTSRFRVRAIATKNESTDQKRQIVSSGRLANVSSGKDERQVRLRNKPDRLMATREGEIDGNVKLICSFENKARQTSFGRQIERSVWVQNKCESNANVGRSQAERQAKAEEEGTCKMFKGARNSCQTKNEKWPMKTNLQSDHESIDTRKINFGRNQKKGESKSIKKESNDSQIAKWIMTEKWLKAEFDCKANSNGKWSLFD